MSHLLHTRMFLHFLSLNNRNDGTPESVTTTAKLQWVAINYWYFFRAVRQTGIYRHDFCRSLAMTVHPGHYCITLKQVLLTLAGMSILTSKISELLLLDDLCRLPNMLPSSWSSYGRLPKESSRSSAKWSKRYITPRFASSILFWIEGEDSY